MYARVFIYPFLTQAVCAATDCEGGPGSIVIVSGTTTSSQLSSRRRRLLTDVENVEWQVPSESSNGTDALSGSQRAVAMFNNIADEVGEGGRDEDKYRRLFFACFLVICYKFIRDRKMDTQGKSTETVLDLIYILRRKCKCGYYPTVCTGKVPLSSVYSLM